MKPAFFFAPLSAGRLAAFVWFLIPVYGLAAPKSSGGTVPVDAKSTPTLRIISLAPNLTESLFALGCGDRVIADTDYCRYPAAAIDRPHVGGLYNPNVERMVSLHPDLVFYLPHHKALAARLEGMGIHTVMVPSETVEDVLSGIRLIGKSVGAGNRADALVRSIRRRIDVITARTRALPRKRVLLAVDHEPGSIRGLYAAGSGNYLDELLRLVGGDNILRHTATTYPKISPEILLRDPPDVVLDSKYAESSQAAGDWEPVMRRAWNDLFKDSAKKPRIEFITEPRVMIPGPSIVLALRILARDVHGAAFESVPTATPAPSHTETEQRGIPSSICEPDSGLQ